MESICKVAATLLLGALVACGGGSGEPAGSGLAAAPGPGKVPGTAPGEGPAGEACGFEHVWITVERIRVRRDNGSHDIALASPRRIDLMGLQGGLLEALGVEPLAPGHYDSLELVLSANGRPGAADGLANAVQVAGASPSPLSTPSGPQSGIKISLDLDIAPGEVGELELQFDACKAAVRAGNSGRYVLKPALGARRLAARFLAEPARLVNTTTAGDQFDPHVAALADGGYAIVWTQRVGTGDSSTYGQKFDATGQRVGSELKLSDRATADGITGLRNGGAAVVMSDYVSGGTAPFVLAQRLDNALAPLGAAQLVVAGNRPQTPKGNDIDALPDGGFLVTAQVTDPRPPSFTDHYVRRFDANGRAVSEPLRLPDHPSADHVGAPASTSVLPSGSWMSAWGDWFCRMGACSNVQTSAALFDGADTQIGSLNINPNPSADESFPATAALRNGNYALAWVVRPYTATSVSPAVRFQVQLFDQSGGEASSVIGIDTPEIVLSGGLQVTALSNGGFLVSLAREVQAGEDSSTVTILGQYFGATGQASGALFPLGSARHPHRSLKSSPTWSVAGLPGGGFVFTSELPAAGGGEDIYQRRFVPAGG